MNDNLIYCKKCNTPMCYEMTVSSDVKTYHCMNCGFMSNTLLKKGEDFYNEQLMLYPELYKDLEFIDDTGHSWFPTAINVVEGMVYANGTSVEDWKWAAVKSVPVLEEEKEKFPNPHKPGEYYERKMDMKTLKQFDDFVDALDYLDVIKNNS